MTTAFEHLRAIGHRRIGLICNDTGELATQLIQRFLAEHPARSYGLPLEDWIAPVPKSFSGGSRAILELKDATCTAVIVQSALQLHGALRRTAEPSPPGAAGHVARRLRGLADDALHRAAGDRARHRRRRSLPGAHRGHAEHPADHPRGSRHGPAGLPPAPLREGLDRAARQ